MSKTSMVLLRIAGGVIGFLVGGWFFFFGGAFTLARMAPGGNTSVGVEVIIFMFVLAFVLGGIPGAVIGATVTHKLLRQIK